MGDRTADGADADGARQPAGHFGHVAGGLLVADVDHAHAGALTCEIEGVQSVAVEGGDEGDVSRFELGNE